jgi:hypothetical protein
VIGTGLLLGLVCLPGSGNAGPAADPDAATRFPLRFESEVVRLFVEADSVRVEGLYVFRRLDSPRSAVSLLFPYPADEHSGGAHTTRLEARVPGGTWRPLEFRELPRVSAVQWRIPLDLADSLEVRTTYRQELRANRVRYVVTTARAWGASLRSARFEIRLPEDAIPLGFSLPFELREGDGGVFFRYEAEDFAPDRDVVVEWEGPPADR